MDGVHRASARIVTLRESSFAVAGPKLFNALPLNLRNYSGSLDSFKSKLDKFLGGVPDKPALPNYPQSAASNSIIDQLAQLRVEGVII